MDDKLFIDVTRRQYHAFWAMFRMRLQACPEEAWDARGEEPPFWQQAYHTLFYSDFYLSEGPRAYQAPAFATGRWHDMEAAPERPLTREQLLGYLDDVGAKLEAVLGHLEAGGLDGENAFPWTGPTVAHRLVYNLRHAQHHLGWMDSLASRTSAAPMEWLCSAD